MKKLFLVSTLFLSLLSVSSIAQSQKIFQSIGSACFTDWGQTPVSKNVIENPYYSVYNVGSTPLITAYNKSLYFSYYTIAYNLRYNVHEMGDNSAIGVNITPAIGLAQVGGDIFNGGNSYIQAEGFGTLNLPAFVSWDFGAGSTYQSTSNMGGVLGFGIEMNKVPVFFSEKTKNVDIKSLWFQPVIITGIRYWSKENKLRELNIKYGFGSAKDYPADNDYYYNSGSQTLRKASAFTIRLSWIIFLNY